MQAVATAAKYQKQSWNSLYRSPDSVARLAANVYSALQDVPAHLVASTAEHGRGLLIRLQPGYSVLLRSAHVYSRRIPVLRLWF